MDFEKLKSEYEEDIKWDFKDLSYTLNNIPAKISKYQNMWFSLKNQHDKITKELDDKWISRFTYYKHDFGITLSNTEIKLFLDKDVEMNDLRLKQKKLLNVLEYLEKCMKNIDSIRWDCKLTLEYEKFKSGEF